MKKIILVLSLFMLSACASTPVQNLTISTQPHVETPRVAPLATRDVHWVVTSKKDEATGITTFTYSLDEDNFKTLLNNLIDIRAYMEDQRQVIGFLGKAANVSSDSSSSSSK